MRSLIDERAIEIEGEEKGRRSGSRHGPKNTAYVEGRMTSFAAEKGIASRRYPSTERNSPIDCSAGKPP